ncbi:MAG TPA: PDZ domain-containing protein [Polyangiaceae bacterium]
MRRLEMARFVLMPWLRHSSCATEPLQTMSPLPTIARLAKLLGGIPVWEVEPDSEAADAGLRFGDIILSVNGVATPTFKRFLAAGGAHLDDLVFEVFRNGKSLKLSPRKAEQRAGRRTSVGSG